MRLLWLLHMQWKPSCIHSACMHACMHETLSFVYIWATNFHSAIFHIIYIYNILYIILLLYVFCWHCPKWKTTQSNDLLFSRISIDWWTVLWLINSSVLILLKSQGEFGRLNLLIGLDFDYVSVDMPGQMHAQVHVCAVHFHAWSIACIYHVEWV